MKAVVIDKVTKGSDVKISEVKMPKVIRGYVLIKVMAFGLNHSEKILRLDEINADYINKPIIPGIECVGIVEDYLDSDLCKGDKVIALMGGMGRSFNGSYAEYTLIPRKNVFKVNSNLDFVSLAAIPETYFTAYGSLFLSLHLQKEDTLLIRGATSALGYASITLAKAVGCKIIATTHKEEKKKYLESLGIYNIMLDDGNITDKVSNVNKVLELVGPKTLRDSLALTTIGGIVCNTGILGNEYYLNFFDPIKEIPNGIYLTSFFSNYPNQKIIDDIFDFINKHNIKPYIGASYNFSDISLALDDFDNERINGKCVIKMN